MLTDDFERKMETNYIFAKDNKKHVEPGQRGAIVARKVTKGGGGAGRMEDKKFVIVVVNCSKRGCIWEKWEHFS